MYNLYIIKELAGEQQVPLLEPSGHCHVWEKKLPIFIIFAIGQLKS